MIEDYLDLNSNEYEKLVSQVIKKMSEDPELSNSGNLAWGKNNHWLGQSDFSHQIDVSLEGPRSVLLVECKHWKNNVPAESFLTLWARIRDIRPVHKGKEVKGALVTSNEFQSGVYTLAKYYNQDVCLLRVRSIEDFVVKFREIHAEVQLKLSAKLRANAEVITSLE